VERELWEEGVNALEEMLPRFRETEQRAAQALTYLGIAQGRRGREEYDIALRAFTDARDLAAATDHRWLLAQAQHGIARVLLDNEDFPRAQAAFAEAIHSVGEITGHLGDRAERGVFLESEVPLFAEAAYTEIRAGNAEHAAEIVRGFAAEANKAGKGALSDLLKQFEDTLNTVAKESDDKTAADALKAQAKRVGELRRLAH
jgi:tetratricopeptide (TPR) repeat protein